MRKIAVPEEGVETLFGSYDENLKHLESLFNVRIRTQGHDLLVEGDRGRRRRASSAPSTSCGADARGLSRWPTAT